MRIAWVSPLLDCGVISSVRFSNLVLPHLQKYHQVELFSEFDSSTKLLIPSGSDGSTLAIEPYHYQRIVGRNREQAFDVFVHQHEDCAANAFVKLQAELWPGLGIFHDISLNRQYESKYSHSTAATDINAIMDRHFGPNSVRLGETFVRAWPTEVYEFLYPFGVEEQRSSASILLLSEEFKSRVLLEGQKLGGDAPQLANPRCCQMPALETSEEERLTIRAKVRSERGLSDDIRLIALLSSKPLSDRLHETLSACARLFRGGRCPEGKSLRLLWIARSESERAYLNKYLERKTHLLGPEVCSLIEVVVCSSWESYLSTALACDLAIALRFDARKGAIPGVFDLMGAGLPLVVSEHGASASLPSDCALKLRNGNNLADIIHESLFLLLSRPSLRTTLGENARAYIREHHDPGIVAEKISRVLVQDRGAISTVFRQRQLSIADKRAELFQRLRDSLDESSRELVANELEMLSNEYF